ncbi:hypothetical protein ACFYMW_30155 [Streptomyces sp. NPDC006692]|uniref:hypothetical protein n=1 Tax=unclassified Streptomyces TaxID=2593676 RepID=UPI00367B79F3
MSQPSGNTGGACFGSDLADDAHDAGELVDVGVELLAGLVLSIMGLREERAPGFTGDPVDDRTSV